MFPRLWTRLVRTLSTLSEETVTARRDKECPGALTCGPLGTERKRLQAEVRLAHAVVGKQVFR